MSSARRPLLTATAAGTLLCALWFVPSANASQDTPARETATVSTSAQVTQVTQARAITAAAQAADQAAEDAELADTGSPDTTPYVVGGSLFLAVGAGFVVYSVRRERLGF
ncbi:LAETG motif-containing sortase-dependent surface protein [Streptomyces naphthomycinicus]|uniref:LAETG motif-containing sortase-dependent surface protein n=1 Tax=Streptomyces naphthomycinicus TaxID=2872625 RepID=UPI001CEC010E|nr:LAETG motif-containing sortase-dependent surface protein [Streptomyces sp. TML10]